MIGEGALPAGSIDRRNDVIVGGAGDNRRVGVSQGIKRRADERGIRGARGFAAVGTTSRSGALPEFEMLSVCDWVCPTTTELKWRLLAEILSEGVCADTSSAYSLPRKCAESGIGENAKRRQ